jgi:catechol 2,3-dioxygenase-like lactoylglutathione lyase family enzyme
MVTGIDHIEIIVDDLDAYVDFFQKLGFEVLARTTHHGGSVEVKLPGDGQPIFELHTVIGEENPGVNHIAFRCDDVVATHADLAAKGVRFASEPHKVASTGRTNANLRDPGGWRMQLVDSKRSQWESDPHHD